MLRDKNLENERWIMLKKLTNIGMACMLALCLAAIGVAQTAGNTGSADNTGPGTATGSTNGATRASDDNRDNNYGWIGLAGLVGLAGLMRRDPDRARDRAHTGPAART
jgi:hypothetical protein